MKKIYKALVLGAALSLTSMNCAWAGGHASLLVVEGNVMVNRGSGFQPAVGAIDLKVGDRILAGENASAVVSYATAACSIMVKAGNVVTIANTAPCVAGMTGGINVTPVAAPVDSLHPALITAGFAAGFGGLVGLTELLTSSPATN